MANRKVTLLRRCKTDDGWRYYPVVVGKTGKIKPGFVLVGPEKRVVQFKVGYYALRSFEGDATVFTRLGENATDAFAAYERANRLGDARESAEAAGAKLVEEPGRKNLRVEFKKFLTAVADRGSDEAEEVYRLAGYEFLGGLNKTYADELTPEDITGYHKELRKRGLAERTVANRHRNLKTFLLALRLDAKVLMPKTPRYEKEVPEIYEPSELSKFLRSFTDLRYQVMFRLMLQCGLREQEAMHLEWSDISVKEQTLKVRAKPKFKFHVKDYEQREVPLAADLLDRLAAFRETTTETGTRILGKDGNPDGHMLRSLKQLVRAAGLNCRLCEGCTSPARECRNWYLHKFRATYCTQLLRPREFGGGGLDLSTVQRMMGHSDIESTMRYLRPAEGVQVQSAVNSIKWV